MDDTTVILSLIWQQTSPITRINHDGVIRKKRFLRQLIQLSFNVVFNDSLPSGQNRRKKQSVGVYFCDNLALYFCLKIHSFRLFFWRFCPLDYRFLSLRNYNEFLFNVHEVLLSIEYNFNYNVITV